MVNRVCDNCLPDCKDTPHLICEHHQNDKPPIPDYIYTKDGLLWMWADHIPLPLADNIAWQYGFPNAEWMVKHLEKMNQN